MSNFYILVDGQKTKEVDMETWAKGVGGDMKVAKDSIGGVIISTVFLGINHNWGEGDPILFETMVFGGDEEICERCSTWEEAENQHETVCDLITKATEQTTA